MKGCDGLVSSSLGRWRGRAVGLFVVWWLLLFACQSTGDVSADDPGAQKASVRAMIDSIEEAVWSARLEGDGGPDRFITMNQVLRTTVGEVWGKRATDVRLVTLNAAFSALTGDDFELHISLLASPAGLHLHRFEHPVADDERPLAAFRSTLRAFRWPDGWRAWEDMTTRVWSELVTSGRPLPSIIGREEARSLMPESGIDLLWPDPRNLSLAREQVLGWCGKNGATGCPAKAYPTGVGLLLFSKDQEEIGLLGVEFALRDDGGLTVERVTFRAIEPGP